MKKRINVLLIIVVCSLWGYIGYRLISNQIHDSKPDHIINNYRTGLINIKRDTFAFEPLKRDPFLNKGIAYERPVVHKKYLPAKQKKEDIIEANTTDPLPQIEYYGYIKSGMNEELAIFKVNKQLLKLHRGENINGILVKHIYKDSVSIIVNKKKLVIKLSN